MIHGLSVNQVVKRSLPNPTVIMICSVCTSTWVSKTSDHFCSILLLITFFYSSLYVITVINKIKILNTFLCKSFFFILYYLKTSLSLQSMLSILLCIIKESPPLKIRPTTSYSFSVGTLLVHYPVIPYSLSNHVSGILTWATQPILVTSNPSSTTLSSSPHPPLRWYISKYTVQFFRVKYFVISYWSSVSRYGPDPFSKFYLWFRCVTSGTSTDFFSTLTPKILCPIGRCVPPPPSRSTYQLTYLWRDV